MWMTVYILFHNLPLRCSGTPHSPCFGRSFRSANFPVREANLVDIYTLEFQTLMVGKRDVTNDEMLFFCLNASMFLVA